VNNGPTAASNIGATVSVYAGCKWITSPKWKLGAFKVKTLRVSSVTLKLEEFTSD
jgi:hypothetical protein